MWHKLVASQRRTSELLWSHLTLFYVNNAHRNMALCHWLDYFKLAMDQCTPQFKIYGCKCVCYWQGTGVKLEMTPAACTALHPGISWRPACGVVRIDFSVLSTDQGICRRPDRNQGSTPGCTLHPATRIRPCKAGSLSVEGLYRHYSSSRTLETDWKAVVFKGKEVWECVWACMGVYGCVWV